MSILITGASGFVGSYLVPELAARGKELVILLRPSAIENFQEKHSKLKSLKLLVGDVLKPGILQDGNEAQKILSEVTDVIHLAALYDLEAPYEESYLANVVGTQNILDFAGALPALRCFHHVSTIAIAGTFKGTLREEMFNVGQLFKTSYARTKYRAEGLVGAWNKSTILRRVYRFGVVVGDSKSGFMPKADGPYYLLDSLKKHEGIWKLLTKASPFPLPFDQEATMPLIPVDVLSKAFAEMVCEVKKESTSLRTYHLTGAHVAVPNFLRECFEQAGIKTKLFSAPRFLFPKALLKSLGIPTELVDFLYARCHFDHSHIKEDYPNLEFPAFNEYAEAFFSYLRGNA